MRFVDAESGVPLLVSAGDNRFAVTVNLRFHGYRENYVSTTLTLSFFPAP
jgi:hypothetical protein